MAAGGHHGVVAGHPSPATTRSASPIDPGRPIAEQFERLEHARYNALGPTDPVPEPTRAEYGAVSCSADLVLMKASGPTYPAIPAHPIYSIRIASLVPDKTLPGRELLTMVQSDSAGNTASGRFYLAREGGAWKVCGLYTTTEPPKTNSTGGGAGVGDGGGSEPTIPGSGGGPGAGGAGDTLQKFGQAVAAGETTAAARALCPDFVGDRAAVNGWAAAHDQVVVAAVDTSAGTIAASARIQVAAPGMAPLTYGLLMAHPGDQWCIELIQKL